MSAKVRNLSAHLWLVNATFCRSGVLGPQSTNHNGWLEQLHSVTLPGKYCSMPIICRWKIMALWSPILTLHAHSIMTSCVLLNLMMSDTKLIRTHDEKKKGYGSMTQHFKRLSVATPTSGIRGCQATSLAIPKSHDTGTCNNSIQ